MADKGIDSRLKLTITEVKERQSVGDRGAVKLGFYAMEGESDKALSYFTFSTRLFETIEKKGEIDCDVNISQRSYDRDGDIQTFTDRKVFQVYVDGQPIGGKRGGGWQDSPEKIASIESQKRADLIAQLWMADKLDKSDDLVAYLRMWLSKLAHVIIPTNPPETKTTKKKPPEPPKGTDPGAVIKEGGKAEDVPFAETEPEDTPFPEEDNATEKLLSQVAEAKSFKSSKTARSYLVNSLKIEDSRIDAEPEAVWEEIKEYFA